MKLYLSLLLLIVIMGACTDESAGKEPRIDGYPSSLEIFNDSGDLFLKSEAGTAFNSGLVQTGGIDFVFKTVAATDFINRKGGKIAPEDMDDLSQELVLLLEYRTNNQDIFSSKKINLNKDEVVKYLSGAIMEDLELIQDGNTISPSGCQFEGSIGSKSTIRTLIFFSKVNLQDDFTLKYNDKIFERGLMNVRLRNKSIQA